MHSLFLRIFMLFLVAMALIVGGSIAVTFSAAAREYESQEAQRRPSVAIPAAEVLAKSGIDGLKAWLQDNKNSLADRDFYIVGPDGTYRFPALSTAVDYEIYAQYKGHKSETKSVSQFDDRSQVYVDLKVDTR